MKDIDKLLEDLDEIFEGEQDYIDSQLARGDSSQSFHGEQMQRCRWCGEEWHDLPITKVMRDMRNGSYGRDEFGYPLIDPDYRYDRDDSDWVCPGSGFYGPETPNKSWRIPRGAASFQGMGGTGLGTGPYRRWRFLPPFDGWDVNLETRWERSPHPNQPDTVTHIATFKREVPVIAPPEIVNLNAPFFDGVHMVRRVEAGIECVMKPVQFEYEDVVLHWDDPNARYAGEDPTWVEFITNHDIAQHTWWMDWWHDKGEVPPGTQLFDIHGHNREESREAVIDTIVDEAYEIPTEALDDYLTRATLRASEATSEQATVSPARGPSVLYFSTAVPEGVEDGVENGAQTGEGET